MRKEIQIFLKRNKKLEFFLCFLIKLLGDLNCWNTETFPSRWYNSRFARHKYHQRLQSPYWTYTEWTDTLWLCHKWWPKQVLLQYT